jgi:hypothetical protein
VGISSVKDLDIGHFAALSELFFELILSHVLWDVLDDQSGRHYHLMLNYLQNLIKHYSQMLEQSPRRNNQAKRKAMILRVKKKGNFEQIIYRYQFPDHPHYLTEARRETYAYLTKLRVLQTHLWRNGYLAKATDLIPKIRKLISNWTNCYETWLGEQEREKQRLLEGFITYAETRGIDLTKIDLTLSPKRSREELPGSETVKRLYENYSTSTHFFKKSSTQFILNAQPGKSISGILW